MIAKHELQAKLKYCMEFEEWISDVYTDMLDKRLESGLVDVSESEQKMLQASLKIIRKETLEHQRILVDLLLKLWKDPRDVI